MKTIRKILPAVLLIAVMLTLSVVGINAADNVTILTAEDTTLNVDITHYTGGYDIVRNATFDTGIIVANKNTGTDGIYQSEVPANTGKGAHTAMQISGLSHLEEASPERPGATTLAGEVSTHYHTMTYEGNNPNGAHTYVTAFLSTNNGNKEEGIRATEEGYIFEFDVTCHPMKDADGNVISGAPDKDVPIQVCNNYNAAADGLFTLINIAAASNSSDFAIKAGGVTYEAPQGTWVHVTVHFDPENHKYNIYVGNENTEFEVTVTDPETEEPTTAMVKGRKLLTSISSMSGEIEVYPISARVGGYSNKGNISYDNFIGYKGSCVRNPFYYEKLQGADLFHYLVHQLERDGVSNVTRKMICDIIEADHIGNYYNRDTSTYLTGSESVKADVDSYLAFYEAEYASLLQKAMDENLENYKAKVAALKNMPRSLYDHADRGEYITAVTEFLTGCGDYIDYTHPEFIAAKDDFDYCVRMYYRDIDTLVFVNAAKKFVGAQKLGAIATMQKKYLEAKEIFDNIDPVADDYSKATDGSYEAVLDAIAIMDGAEELLAQQYRIANTNRFVGIVDKISETKLSDWEADDGTIENLWRMALNIVGEDNYEKNLAFYEAYTRFEAVNNYFWESIQDTHIAALNEKLAQFDNVNYIDKEGICAFVDSYIERYKHEIDLENEEIKAIITLNTMYKDGLPGYKESYKLQLESNTREFVKIVATMDGVTEYTALKAIYDAATVYYYSMNISEENVIAAVAAYESARLRLEEIEYASEVFAYEMSKITAESSADDVYKVLVACYPYREIIDDTYEGITAVRESFDQLYEAHLSASSVIEAETGKLSAVVSSVRSFCGVSDLMRYTVDYLEN